MSILHIPVYGAWLTGQVVIASTQVMADAFRRHQKQKPILIGMPLRITSDNEIVGLSASILRGRTAAVARPVNHEFATSRFSTSSNKVLPLSFSALVIAM